VVRITKDGHDRTDIVTELLKYLRYRYELSERVLAHHTKLAADAMIGKLLEMWRDATWTEIAVRRGHARQVTRRKQDLTGLRAAIEGRTGRREVAHIDSAVVEALEAVFLTRGDDGILEWIVDWAGSAEPDGRTDAIERLATDVLNRRLFKPIGRAGGAHEIALAQELYDRFGRSPEERRRLEQEAARFAEISEKWQLVMWLPAPKMRLKVAEVLVERNGQISPLDRVGNERAVEIYASHKQLWAISVFADPGVADDDASVLAALSYLGEQLGVRFQTRKGVPVPGVTDLAVDRVADERKLARERAADLRAVVAEELDLEVAAHGRTPTIRDIENRVDEIGTARRVLRRRDR
jgi:hypothetical protein